MNRIDGAPARSEPEAGLDEDLADRADLEALAIDSDEVPADGTRRRLRWGRQALVAVVAGVIGAGVGAAVSYQEHRGDVRLIEEQLIEVQQRNDELLAALSALDGAVISVPDTVGLPLGEARQRLGARRLRPAVNDGDDDRSESLIVAQEPPGGTLVPSGATVGLRTRSR